MIEDFFKVIEDCLICCDVQQKIAKVEAAYQHFGSQNQIGELTRDGEIIKPAEVGFPERPELVHLKFLPKRSFKGEAGRAALLHAIAHIEFNAINLALDAAYRFRGMPVEYYLDWLRIADDEVRHFKLLEKRLEDYGVQYGDLPAHRGLWDMAEKTAHSILERMALIPRYMEARGLDVTPGMIQKLESVGDQESVAILKIILEEEVSHVEAGSRWFSYLCNLAGQESETAYFEIITKYMPGNAPGSLNVELRKRAGFSQREIDLLQQR
ncbi:MAG: DUF455 domain-containing protein [Gammaproteobacteria bacterium]|nr:MAG: DUF455 domain-containing protein [Gammaproteobacteria bacterium]RLA23365.1 MAG: DUF455 domain-containing protein [Gammaproteobacteria bacterium]